MPDSLPPLRRLLKVFHPEGIPWPGTVLYNWLSSSRIFQRHYERVAQDVGGYCQEGALLDIGTGPGWLLLRVHEELPQLRLAGLDISPSMVAQARQNMSAAGLAEQVEIRQGSASGISFEDGSFDVVVSTGSIHHWKEPTKGLNEVHRVLKAGGWGLIYDLVSDAPASVIEQSKREFGRLRTTLFWLHGFEEPFYSRENYEALARPTLFKEGRFRFVGLLACLILRKNTPRASEEKA